MTERLLLARGAMRSALQLRRSLSIAREDPVNVYDIADALGVEVRFADRPSLEGMFGRDPHPVIVLPSLQHRPRGRVTYSCAHEIGHFQLGHGTRVDEYLADGDDSHQKSDDEFAADTFASSLLMPRPAVLRRFQVRDWKPSCATPLQLFAIAGELDVGYVTLVKHLRYGLTLTDETWLHQRLRTTPKQLREEVLGQESGGRVLLADDHWPQVPLDLEVGDVVAVPQGIEAEASGPLSESRVSTGWRHYAALRPGRGRIRLGDAAHAVRVARAGYCGFLKYRYLEDPDAA